MEEKILDTIKDMLGINDKDNAFDNEVLVNINATFSTLYQLGVGSEGHYIVLDGTETWEDVFEEKDLIDFIKLYTYMKVKLVFDPPTNSSILQALNEQMREIEYRILLQADPADYFNSDYIRGSKYSVSFEKVEYLPDVGEPNVIYLVANNAMEDNSYDEYFWIEEDSKFELFGTVGIEPVADKIIESEYEKYIKPYLNKNITIKKDDSDD